MTTISYTLVSDGSSDRVLDYPIRWALRRLKVRISQSQWADLRLLPSKTTGLEERVHRALEYYPADILFVHRDAEAIGYEHRLQEVMSAVVHVATPSVALVPVRMSEAWLLHDEQAIRRASGNPNGRVPLELPPATRVEALPDPKSTLFEQLIVASELSGRRREKQERPRELARMRARTAELITDYSPLLAAPAFAAFVASLQGVVRQRCK